MSRIECVGECRTPYSKEELAFYAKLKKLQSDQPKVKARNFGEFSSRIIKVEYSNGTGNCCIRGHDADALYIPEFLRRSQV